MAFEKYPAAVYSSAFSVTETILYWESSFAVFPLQFGNYRVEYEVSNSHPILNANPQSKLSTQILVGNNKVGPEIIATWLISEHWKYHSAMLQWGGYVIVFVSNNASNQWFLYLIFSSYLSYRQDSLFA